LFVSRWVRWIGLALLLVAAGIPAFAAVPPPPGFVSADDITRFVNDYRQHPRPALLPAAVRAMARLGLLADEEGAAVHIGFIAGALGGNQVQAEKLIAAMLPLRSDEQAVLIKAIAFSGLPNWRGILNDFVDRLADHRKLIDSLSTGKSVLLMAKPVDEGRTLDMLWGYYLATGYYEPIQRIITVLPWSDNRENLDKLAVGSMAKWTLASNAAKDPDLLKLYYSESQVVPDKVAKPLKDVIDAVEMAETSRIKKDAQAAIEDLKAKGPASKRTLAWDAQLGTTAIAAGCIAAEVTGHVELGIPCIITGAVSQAASKMVTSDGWSAKSLGLGFGGD
jgi:hypothetical protein